MQLDGRSLTIEGLAAAAGGAEMSLAPEGLARMEASAALIARSLEEDTPVYGVTTGLGPQATQRLGDETRDGFSLATLRGRAHSAGQSLPASQSRAGLIARLNTFLLGYSGARPELAAYLCAVLNTGVAPVMGRIGSVGAADLLLNASAALPVMGEGDLMDRSGAVHDAGALLELLGMVPPALAPREGLALCSHTGHSAGLAALGLVAAERAFDHILGACALTFEGFRANLSPIDAQVLAVKPLPGQMRAAKGLRRWLKGSLLNQEGRARRLQDPLSIRNSVQMLGGVAQALAHAREITELELNGGGDNPITLEDRVVSGGAYFTTELGLAIEGVIRALHHMVMGQMARMLKLLNADLSGLPPMLGAGVVGAAGFAPVTKLIEDLCAEIAHLSQPASLWPNHSASGVEDAMNAAPVATRALLQIVEYCNDLNAIEMMIAAQAVELRGDQGELGRPLAELFVMVRQFSPKLEADRALGQEIRILSAHLGQTSL